MTSREKNIPVNYKKQKEVNHSFMTLSGIIKDIQSGLLIGNTGACL
jgi:hypothetical protein